MVIDGIAAGIGARAAFAGATAAADEGGVTASFLKTFGQSSVDFTMEHKPAPGAHI